MLNTNYCVPDEKYSRNTPENTFILFIFRVCISFGEEKKRQCRFKPSLVKICPVVLEKKNKHKIKVSTTTKFRSEKLTYAFQMTQLSKTQKTIHKLDS